jgi:hypothetical protein
MWQRLIHIILFSFGVCVCIVNCDATLFDLFGGIHFQWIMHDWGDADCVKILKKDLSIAVDETWSAVYRKVCP